MAMRMQEVESRVRERQMLMAAMQMNALSAQAEEDRMLQMALEESKNDNAFSDPTAPDVDNMTYEQLLELGDNAGKVSKGLTTLQKSKIRSLAYLEGRTTSDTCTICMEKFKTAVKFKKLPCGHEYHAECID